MLKKFLLLNLSLVSIQGCAILGVGGVYQSIDVVTTGVNVVSYGTTGKGLSDHAASAVTGKDCEMLNILKNKDICYEGTSLENKNYLIGIYEENYEWPVQSVKKNTPSPVNGLPVNKSINKGKNHEYKLGTRHKRHAHKVRSKRSNSKAECKPPRRIFGIPDPFLARRTGRNETCSKK
jgi:hypothetical protein